MSKAAREYTPAEIYDAQSSGLRCPKCARRISSAVDIEAYPGVARWTCHCGWIIDLLKPAAAPASPSRS